MDNEIKVSDIILRCPNIDFRDRVMKALFSLGYREFGVRDDRELLLIIHPRREDGSLVTLSVRGLDLDHYKKIKPHYFSSGAFRQEA